MTLTHSVTESWGKSQIHYTENAVAEPSPMLATLPRRGPETVTLAPSGPAVSNNPNMTAGSRPESHMGTICAHTQ